MSIKWVVCPRCDGEGSHVNPAVDGHGITSDEMDELGPDFFDDYMGGVYDVTCERCKGRRVVRRCRVLCDSPAEVGYVNCYEHMSEGERADFDEAAYLDRLVDMERRAGA